jgi:hypothetical protein
VEGATGSESGRPQEREILSDRVETVTPWLADKILANKKNGTRIQWLSRSKVVLRFLESPFRKRKILY